MGMGQDCLAPYTRTGQESRYSGRDRLAQLEVRLARLEMGDLRFEASDESFPTAMDIPRNKDAAEIYLGSYRLRLISGCLERVLSRCKSRAGDGSPPSR
jgi:hypothetical protein